MPETIVLRAQGLKTAPGASGDPEQDGLLQADNVVVGRQGIWEFRRGFEEAATFADHDIDYLAPFRSLILAHTTDGHILRWDPDGAAAPEHIGADYTLPDGGMFHGVEDALTAFIGIRGGVVAIESPTATPAAAGMPAGLDCQGALVSGLGTAVAKDSQVAYRVVFGRKDANGRLILGAPSGRGVVQVGSGLSDAVKDITVKAALPTGLPSDSIVQYYRSLASVSDDVTPSDELFLAYEAAVPPTAGVTKLSRSGTTVTATTGSQHKLWAGMEVYLPTGLGGSATLLSVLGEGYAESSTDGSSWTSRTPGSARSLAWSPGLAKYVGCRPASSNFTTSSDGTTWSSVAVAADFQQVIWGERFVAVGGDATGGATGCKYAYSTNGTSFTSGNMGTTTKEISSVAYGASKYIATGWRTGGSGYDEYLCSVSSTLGASWSDETISSIARDRTTEGSSFHETFTNTNWSTVSGSPTWGTTYVYLGNNTQIRNQYTVTVGKRYRVKVRAAANGASSNQFSWAVGTSAGGTQYAYAEQSVPSGSGTDFSVEFTATSTALHVQLTAPAGQTGMGINCTLHTAVELTKWFDSWRVAWGNGTFVAIDSSGRVATSANGTSWTAQTALPSGSWYGLWYSEKHAKFLALGTDKLYISTDGTGFSACVNQPTGAWRSAANFNGTIYIVGQDVLASATDLSTWSSSTHTGAWFAIVANTPYSIPAGLYTVTSPASGTYDTSAPYTFQFETAATGTVAEADAVQDATVVSVAFTDTVPEAQLGAALYTNESQDGILSRHDQPPECMDMAVFKGHVLYAQPRRRASMIVTLLKVGTGGLVANDVVTLPGGTVTAKAAEDVVAKEFAVSSGSTPASLDVYKTVLSLCRVINRNPSLGAVAVPLSDPGSATPGAFMLTATDPLASVSFSVSANQFAWSPSAATTVEARREVNQVAVSIQNVPDAVPLTRYFRVGTADKQVVRMVPLRDSVLLFKEDGLWRLSGDTFDTFSVQPLDPTCQLVAPRSAAVLSNVCVALTTAGVVGVTDAGVKALSSDIQDRIDDLLVSSMLDATWWYAFGIAYESEGSYTLFVPESAEAVHATRGWTLNTATGAWTSRTDEHRAVTLRPDDNRLYSALHNAVRRERKDFAYTDYADAQVATGLTVTAVYSDSVLLSSTTGILAGDVLDGPAGWSVVTEVDGSRVYCDRPDQFVADQTVDVLRGITATLKWRHAYQPGGPGRLSHSREVGLVFRDAQLSRPTVSFASDIMTAESSVAVDASQLGLVEGAASTQPRTVRVLVTPNHQRGGKLEVAFEHTAAWRPMQLEAMTLTYEPGGERVGK